MLSPSVWRSQSWHKTESHFWDRREVSKFTEASDSKIRSWVPWDLEPRITVLARASSNLAVSQIQTPFRTRHYTASQTLYFRGSHLTMKYTHGTLQQTMNFFTKSVGQFWRYTQKFHINQLHRPDSGNNFIAGYLPNVTKRPVPERSWNQDSC
jgi:hypothetical protein